MKQLHQFILIFTACFALKFVCEAAVLPGKAQSSITQGGFFTNQGMITPKVDSIEGLQGAVVTNFTNVFVIPDSSFRYHFAGDSTWHRIHAVVNWSEVLDPPPMVTKAQGDGYWKPLAYTPSNTEVISAIGYTPYNGTTNPNGYIASVPAQSFTSLTGKPSTLAGYGITDAYPLTGNPSNFLTAVPAQSFSSLTGKPTTLNGYGITDAYPLTGNPAGYLSSVPAQTFASITGKPTTLSGYGIIDAYSSSNPNGFVNTAGVRTAISLTTTGVGAATYNNSTGVLNIPTPASPATTYANTATTSGGNAIFYLTNDKTSTGTALYTIVNTVMPIVNDATLNYTYGWTLSADKKTLTVNARASVGINVSLVGLTLLGVPTNVPNGTPVSVLVNGQ